MVLNTDHVEMGDVQIGDIDLENFADFEERAPNQEGEELQDAQEEQWPEDIGFSPQGDIVEEEEGGGGLGEGETAQWEEEQLLRDEEMLINEADALIPPKSHSSTRTIGQKWRSPSHLDTLPGDCDGGGPQTSVPYRQSMPGKSDVGVRAGEKRSRVVKPGESSISQRDTSSTNLGLSRTTGRHLIPSFRDSTACSSSSVSGSALSGGRKCAVASVRPLNVPAGHQQGGGVGGGGGSGGSGGAVPVVPGVLQAVDVWADSPLVRVKVSCCVLYNIWE